MHIVHIAAELAPIAKVGGLADVLLGLSRELSWKGHDVDIIIPKYDCLNSEEVRDLTIDYHHLMSYYEGEWFSNTIWTGWVDNLKVYFIDAHHPRHFFHRGCFYGCEDDTERYLYFSRAAIEFMFKKGLRPDVIHLHDWQPSIIATLYKDMYRTLGFNKAKVILSIHNMEYQGKCSPVDLTRIGLLGEHYLTPQKLQDNQNPTSINLLKGGIVYSDAFTTVSPTYAKEVLLPENGKGLESTISLYQDKFHGILNGLDYSYWNPEIDRYLPAHYSLREIPLNKDDRNTIDKKAYLKNLLRERLMLEETHKPLVGCITRLVPQKGIELIKHNIFRTLEKGGQFVFLGSGPIPSINAEFQALKARFENHPDVRLILLHQEELAHLIYAAADIFIVPSLFEPCGLTQMISLKYGAIPVVRRTGGLADTIFDVDYSGRPFENTNGYTFDNPDNASFDHAFDRAIDCWFHHPERWRRLMIQGMHIDFSWNKPADQYLALYRAESSITKS